MNYLQTNLLIKPVIIILLGMVSSCQTKHSAYDSPIRIPGEFEPQEAIWLGYRTSENYDVDDTVTLEMIRAIHPHVEVKLIIEHDSLVNDVFSELSLQGIDTTKIELVFQSDTDVWYRDPGPVFAVENNKDLKIIDFKYTGYANIPPDSVKEWALKHERIDRDIAQRLGIDTINSIVALEGGAFETNGQGVLIQVEDITLKRNPHLTKVQIEADFKKCCGIEKVIWLPSGVADDPHNFDRIHDNIFGIGTGGHTDEFVRFANASTILLSWVDELEKDTHPIKRLNHQRLSKNFEILSQSTDANGKPFEIIKVPHPDPKLDTAIVEEDWFNYPTWEKRFNQFGIQPNDTVLWSYAKSYMNYLITNEVAIIPQYGDAEGPINAKDLSVRQLFEKLYPKRKIVGLNPLLFNDGGGGMHCRFQTQPKINTNIN